MLTFVEALGLSGIPLLVAGIVGHFVKGQIVREINDKSWRGQQVWVRKQEIYDSIFQQLFRIKSLLRMDLADWWDWEYLHNYWNHTDPRMTSEQYQLESRKLEKLKKEHMEQYEASKEERKERERQKKQAIDDLLHFVGTKAVFLDSSVTEAVDAFKKDLADPAYQDADDLGLSDHMKHLDNLIGHVRETCAVELKL
ncbi:hypothetical protein BVY04_05480 [bacterium M21]|nr:hypothetical protein BVY04_05480 [bacterium M21]